jgi:3-oxo-5-alpha-steroid 4-dehydrogenase 3
VWLVSIFQFSNQTNTRSKLVLILHFFVLKMKTFILVAGLLCKQPQSMTMLLTLDAILRCQRMQECIALMYLLLTIGSLIVAVCPSFSSVANHGKMNIARDDSRQWLLDKLTVPKSFFTYMYLISVMVCVVLSLILLTNERRITITVPAISLSMFLVHSIRRVLECLLMTVFHDSRMNVGGFFAGIAHYVVVPLTLYESSGHGVQNGNRVMTAVSLALYAGSSLCQWYCHHILYVMKLRSISNAGRSISYSLPTSFMFRYVTCPHYFCEICIYFSLYLLDFDSPLKAAMLIWVSSNLTVVSCAQYDWYLARFSDNMRSKNIHRLIPFVW